MVLGPPVQVSGSGPATKVGEIYSLWQLLVAVFCIARNCTVRRAFNTLSLYEYACSVELPSNLGTAVTDSMPKITKVIINSTSVKPRNR